MNSLRMTAALTLLGLVAPAARSQESASHIPIGNWDARNNPARAADMANRIRSTFGQPSATQQVDPALIKQLLDRFNQQDPQQLEDLFKNNADLAKGLRNITGDNPELRRQIEERMQAKQPGFDQATRDKLDAAIKGFRNRAAPPDLTNHPNGNIPGSMNGPPPGPVSGPSTPPSGPSITRPKLPNPSGSVPPPEDQLRGDRLRELANRLDRWAPKSFKNSDAMKRFTSRLGDIDWGKAAQSRVLPDALGRNLDLSRRFSGAGRLLERSLGRLEGRRLPNLPNINAPTLPSAPSLGAPGTPSAAGTGSAFTVLLILGSLLFGGFLTWKLIIQPAQALKVKPKEWGPGSWPIDPTRVRSREELIKAYDHLALLNGGKPARHWHHRQVANQLGSNDAARKDMADRLSQIYANARYAPPQELVPEAQIEAARKDLCSLAGVAAP